MTRPLAWRPWPAPTAPEAAPGGPSWTAFLWGFLAILLGSAAILFAFVAVADPYGSRVRAGGAPRPIMDANQRFMYPQLVRSGRYDGAVFGTSTIRLLDPVALGAAFGSRIVNLGLSAGTPWEQMQLAGLFLDAVPRPAFLLFSLDRTWCEPDADAPAKRLTYRAFPAWLYDDDLLNDYAHLFNLKSLEIAARLSMAGIGRAKERFARDGYEIFTPPEGRYDAARAAANIWGDGVRRIEPVEPPVAAIEGGAAAFPALAWLDTLLARVPPDARRIVMFPPVHIAAQARPGSREAALDAACKERTAAIAAAHGATVVDFRIRSPVTAEDTNYWDALHYRLPVATRIAAGLEAARTGQDAPDGFFRVLRR